ncbi:MAG TPA: lysoplasmalogenase [Bacteroidetes bacterium]|nr:lysoplasmalogenase [Bacteroidota bacterium]
MTKKTIGAAIFIFAVSAIFARYSNCETIYFILKPLTTLLVISVAALAYKKNAGAYSRLVLTALIFSLVGDVFLLKEEYFVFGLSSFLVAHLFFTYAFTRVNGFSTHFLSFIVLGIFGLLYFRYLKPGLGRFVLPVAVYSAAIILMAWQAVGLYLNDNKKIFLSVAIGALLFTFSDSMIAVNKFKAPFESAGILILASYWAAISIFAFSCHYIGETKN